MCRCNATPRGSQDRPFEISDSEYTSSRVTSPRALERLTPIEEPASGNNREEVMSDRDRGEDLPIVIVSGNQGVTRVRPPVSVLSLLWIVLMLGRVAPGCAKVLPQTPYVPYQGVAQGT